MVVFILAPFVFLWTADNNEFLEKVTDADWEYIGYQDPPPGPQPDGSYAVTFEVDGKTFVLFKQRPLEKRVHLAGTSESRWGTNGCNAAAPVRCLARPSV